MSTASFDAECLLRRDFAPIEQRFGTREAILYALCVGYGSDPLREDELPFVYEAGLRAAPTLALVIGYPGFWMQEPDTGIHWQSVLHAAQTLELHEEIPTEGEVVGHVRVIEVQDKGADKGAFITTERVLRDKSSGRRLATATQSYIARRNGGFAPAPAPTTAVRVPSPGADGTPPTAVADHVAPANAALLYRLCGDLNPLHADPAVARGAGFEKPILHGLCTYAMAARAVLRHACGYDTTRMRRINARFTAPAYPGETIRTEMWQSGSQVQFRVIAAERSRVILDHGVVDLR